MVIEVKHMGSSYHADLSQPIDISLPMRHGDSNPNCFWAEPVDITTITVGDYVGSVALGGSTNYQRISMTPHGNGTHTECYGHLSSDTKATIDQCLKRYHFIAELITVPLTELPNGDLIVSFEDFRRRISSSEPAEAIIIRTQPNTNAKKTQQYSGNNPPYLDATIATYMAEHGIEHLLIDLPSLDRESDGGRLEAHKGFWQLKGNIRASSTITELIYVPDDIEDGKYLLNIQIPHIVIDAVPSKPLIYMLTKLD